MAKYKAKIGTLNIIIEANTIREAAIKLKQLKEDAIPLPEETELTLLAP